MFESQAKEVYEMLILEEDIQSLMNKNIGDYPPMFVGIIGMTIDGIAMKWIKEHKPNAWFRHMFDEV
jgi:hypothetical protein